jgi:hypothetical protein
MAKVWQSATVLFFCSMLRTVFTVNDFQAFCPRLPGCTKNHIIDSSIISDSISINGIIKAGSSETIRAYNTVQWQQRPSNHPLPLCAWRVGAAPSRTTMRLMLPVWRKRGVHVLDVKGARRPGEIQHAEE